MTPPRSLRSVKPVNEGRVKRLREELRTRRERPDTVVAFQNFFRRHPALWVGARPGTDRAALKGD